MTAGGGEGGGEGKLSDGSPGKGQIQELWVGSQAGWGLQPVSEGKLIFESSPSVHGERLGCHTHQYWGRQESEGAR